MSSPFRCPRHNVALVARVLVSYKHNGTYQTVRTRYFACPVAECDFKRPDKWANRKRYAKET
jgi:hypothetical protein